MKYKLLLVLFVCSTVLFSQEDKLKFHSVSIAPANYYFDAHVDGFAASIDVNFNKGKHIFKILGLVGDEVKTLTFGPGVRKNSYEINILYGRELKVNNWLYFDFFGGVGYFEQVITIPERIPGSGSFNGLWQVYEYENKKDRAKTIGFPLQSRIRFKTGFRFSLGLQLHANLNSVNAIYTLGPFVQWRFGNSKKINKNSN
ncbi:MAG: hypothetical protein PSN34_14750 [Urechidicola sp.]|nr:hypothetical protein [Urechidicola sp.]